MAKAFEATTGNKVEAKYGASGLLRKEITDGAKADIFASANMEHPQALNDDGTSGPVALFARNKLCALVKPGLDVTTNNLLARMLDDKVKLATSTPRADPSGDYALEVFTKAEALKPGAQERLEQKARKLTGGKDSAVRRPAALSMAGTSRKVAPTSFLPIAPMRWRRANNIPPNRSSNCRTRFRSAPITD